jgi:hypothetical protein
VKRRKPVQNINIPKTFILFATRHKSKTAQNVAKKLTLCPEYKVLSFRQIKHITEYHSSYFQAWWWLYHVMGMLVIGKD